MTDDQPGSDGPPDPPADAPPDSPTDAPADAPTDPSADPPPDGWHFDDLSVGDRFELGTTTVTREDIVSFASEYDPQPFHVDPEAAAETPHGDVIASGWHTGAMTMRLLVEGLLGDAATVGAVGADDVRFHEPVRPDDELAVAAEVVGREPWGPDRGLVDLAVEARVDGETVFSYVGKVLFDRR